MFKRDGQAANVEVSVNVVAARYMKQEGEESNSKIGVRHLVLTWYAGPLQLSIEARGGCLCW